jgi:N-methylhydantoinase B
LLGGKPGAPGELILGTGERPNPKSLIDLKSDHVVHLNTPGGGGYGEPFGRGPERVRQDVIEGYVSAEAAARDYGVVVRFMGKDDEMVRLPEQWVIDEAATAALRRTRR